MRGFTLLEVLVAMAISTMVIGAVFAVILPGQAQFQAQLESADLQHRLRYANRRIASDLMNADRVLPYRSGAVANDPQSNVFFRPSTITAVSAAESHTYALRADAATGAYQLMHYDGGLGEFPVVDHVLLLAFSYVGDSRPAGCQTPMGTPPSLVPIEPAQFADGPWCPDAVSPSRLDADITRIRRVSVRLRLQVAHASLRGPAGPLFMRGGVASSAERFVPDRDIRFDVALRNIPTVSAAP